jgi:hypothetical protein
MSDEHIRAFEAIVAHPPQPDLPKLGETLRVRTYLGQFPDHTLERGALVRVSRVDIIEEVIWLEPVGPEYDDMRSALAHGCFGLYGGYPDEVTGRILNIEELIWEHCERLPPMSEVPHGSAPIFEITFQVRVNNAVLAILEAGIIAMRDGSPMAGTLREALAMICIGDMSAPRNCGVELLEEIHINEQVFNRH